MYAQYCTITHASNIYTVIAIVYTVNKQSNRSRKHFISITISQTSGMIELATSGHGAFIHLLHAMVH